MGWDAVVFGELKVPSAKAEAWLAQATSPSQFKGWPDFFDADFSERPPEVLIEELKAAFLSPHEFLDLTLDGGTVTVRAMVAKDAFLDARMPLAVLWRSAAAFGGKGEVVFFGYQTIQFGYRVKVGAGKSSVKMLTNAEQAAVEKSKTYKALDARVAEGFEALVGGKGKGKGKNPFTGKKRK